MDPELKGRSHGLENQSVSYGPRLLIFLFFVFFFIGFFYPCCSNFMRIEHIVESTPALPFLTNFRVDMAGFVNSHNVITRSNAFLTLSSAQNGGESKGGAKSGTLKCQFSEVKGDVNLQQISKLLHIPKEGSCDER
jgi:hypothetical protein